MASTAALAFAGSAVYLPVSPIVAVLHYLVAQIRGRPGAASSAPGHAGAPSAPSGRQGGPEDLLEVDLKSGKALIVGFGRCQRREGVDHPPGHGRPALVR